MAQILSSEHFDILVRHFVREANEDPWLMMHEHAACTKGYEYDDTPEQVAKRIICERDRQRRYASGSYA
jgi:hypothetical protein